MIWEQQFIDQVLPILIQGQGRATTAQLQSQGITAQELDPLVAHQVLAKSAPDTYILSEPLVDIDVLVLAHWAVPSAIVGGLTALVYRSFSVAQLVALDLFVLDGVAIPDRIGDMAVRRHVLPPQLLAYGVTSLTPSLPGSVAVPMFTPAIALAQILSDAITPEETCQDAVLAYLAEYDRDQNLTDALSRYGVTPTRIDQLVAATVR